MSTPCILALGTRESWRGVPCKMEGGLSSTGPALIDRIVRSGSVSAAAKTLVVDSPFGWCWAGGEQLTEEDEFLVGDGLSEATPSDTLDNHYAIYLLDPASSCLQVKILPEDRWLDPVSFGGDGAVMALPAWYPRPTLDSKVESRPMPPEVKKRVQAFCDENRIRMSVLLGALRQWCIAILGDLSGATWILAEGSSEAPYLGGPVGKVMVYVAADADGTELKGSDGRLRHFNIQDVRLAGKIFGQLAQLPRYAGTLGSSGLPRPGHASQVIEMLLSAAYEAGSGVPGALVTWRVGSGTWSFMTPVRHAAQGTVFEDDPVPSVWLPLFLSWLLAAGAR